MSESHEEHLLGKCDTCPYDPRICSALHDALDAKLSSIHWLFGIVITLNISFFVFTGWLSTRVTTLDVERAAMSEKLNMVEARQQQVLTKLDSISEKISSYAQASIIRDKLIDDKLDKANLNKNP